MKRRAHPTRIGLFVLGAVALLVLAVWSVFGAQVFAQRDRAVAQFEGSVYGLQVGAPVVFRGVRVGTVDGVGVVRSGQPGQYGVPVRLMIEREAFGGVAVSELVSQGLTAQLATQSLLTGLLYVDLDLVPAAAAAPTQTPEGVRIPTRSSPIQSVQKQLQSLDLERLLADVSAVAAGARQLVGNPKLQQGLEDLAASGAELRQLLAAMRRETGPLAGQARATLDSARQTLQAWGQAAAPAERAVDRVARAADAVDRSMARIDGAAEAAAPALASVQRAADELARTAAGLRETLAADAPALQQAERASADLARAARAVRELAELLERQPDALLRGRSPAP